MKLYMIVLYCVIKVYIVCYPLAQITYLGKMWFPRAKMLVPNQIADFLSQLYLQNKMMKRPDFLACRYKFIEIKS